MRSIFLLWIVNIFKELSQRLFSGGDCLVNVGVNFVILSIEWLFLMYSESCFLKKAKNQVAFAVQENGMQIRAQANFFLSNWELKL